MNFFSKIIIIFCIFTTSAVSEILKKIEITGNKRISKDTILVLGQIKLNKKYDNKELNEVLKKLYENLVIQL